MGVPVAQSMFAGASLITTFLLSGESKSLLSPVTLDSMARYVLVNILSFLQDFSNDRVSLVQCIHSPLLTILLL